MSGPGLRYRFDYAARLGAFSALGAGAYPVALGRVVARQARADRGGRGRERGGASEASLLDTGPLATALAFLPDLAVYLSESSLRPPRVSYPYPAAFSRARVSVAEGGSLACRVARQARPADHPTLILVPGMFATASQNISVRLARRAHERWRYNVVVADMRGFGETGRACGAPTSLTLHEGRDVAALAAWARRHIGSARVFCLGFSYGGAVALAAAAEGGLDRAIAFCPPVRLGRLLDRLSSPVRPLSAFGSMQGFYTWLLWRGLRERGIESVRSFADYVERVAAPYYGHTRQSLEREVDLLRRSRGIQARTLVIHAEDDPVVPADEGLALARATAGLGRVETVTTRRGGHYGHWAVMPRWTERTVREFLA